MDKRFKSRWTIVAAFVILGLGVSLYVLTDIKFFLFLGFILFAFLFVKK